MITARWLEKRKPYWDRLEAMVERSGRRGLAALSYHELQELSLLYRQVASDLSSVREDPMSRRLANYLNQLLGRAHNLIYMGRRPRPGGIVRFYRQTFPQVFRATIHYSLAAFILFLAAALVGFLASVGDPSFQRFLLGGRMADSIERRQMWTHSILTIKPLATSGILTNNLVVSFMAFALGITGGIGTFYILAMNGLLLGVISAACWQAGLSAQLWGFVAPHGVLELPSVFIAGGAGLLLARGLLFPGLLPRGDALVWYGGQGVRLALGIIPLLVVAGVAEGFFRLHPCQPPPSSCLPAAWEAYSLSTSPVPGGPEGAILEIAPEGPPLGWSDNKPRPQQGTEKGLGVCHRERSERSKFFVSSRHRDASLALSMTCRVFEHPVRADFAP